MTPVFCYTRILTASWVSLEFLELWESAVRPFGLRLTELIHDLGAFTKMCQISMRPIVQPIGHLGAVHLTLLYTVHPSHLLCG